MTEAKGMVVRAWMRKGAEGGRWGGAVVRGATVRGVIVRGAVARGAVVRGAVVRGATVRGVVVRGVMVLLGVVVRGVTSSELLELQVAVVRGSAVWTVLWRLHSLLCLCLAGYSRRTTIAWWKSC